MKTLFALVAALFLAACASTGQPQMTPAEIAARACPPLESTIAVLMVSPAISAEAKTEIDKATPVIHALCVPGAVPNSNDLKDLANTILPAIGQIVSTSSMDDKEKQQILLTIALAQVAIAALR